GYMKLKLKSTSIGEEEREAITVVGLTRTGANIIAARDGALGWTNRAVRVVHECYLAGASGDVSPLAVDGDEQWVYVLRPSGVLHRFLVAAPPPTPGSKEPPPTLPEAQSVQLERVPTCLALTSDEIGRAHV